MSVLDMEYKNEEFGFFFLIIVASIESISCLGKEGNGVYRSLVILIRDSLNWEIIIVN